MVDPIWRSNTEDSINFLFYCHDWPENYYSGIFISLKTVFNSDFAMTGPIWRPYIRFFRENQEILVWQSSKLLLECLRNYYEFDYKSKLSN